MTFKKFGALLLAGAMMTGTLGVMSPTQAKAATSENTYTMKVPANVDIQKSGWNSLGNIQITGPVGSLKKVTVTATTINGFKLMDEVGTNSVSYIMKTAENGSEQKSFEFAAASINEDGGASQAFGVDVDDFAGKPVGTYTDTIRFTGTMSEGLAYSEADALGVEIANGNNSLYFHLEGLKSGTIDYTIEFNESSTDYMGNLQINGNVFTFTCGEVKFELDFSNKKYKFIQNNSNFEWMNIMHEKATGERDYWVNNLQP